MKTDPPEDFLLEWYKLHRAHELELNKATLAYELELAKLLVLLNGAAAGAFLTLIGAIWKDAARPVFCWAAGAISAWLLGLFVAAIATDCAYQAQREYTKAYRHRRQGEELRQIGGSSIIKKEHLGIIDENQTTKADSARKKADFWSDIIIYFRYAAVVLFVIGGFSALESLYAPLTSPPGITSDTGKASGGTGGTNTGGGAADTGKASGDTGGTVQSVEIIASAASALIALAALLFSIVTFKRQQDRADTYARASVKPLLQIRSQNYDDLKSIKIVNYGVGPAIIRKAEFRRGPEDVPTNKIVDLFNLNIVWESFVNVPESRAIPAEEEILLIKQSLAHLLGQGHDEKKALAILAEWKHQKTGILVRIEYEDIYGNPMTPLVKTLG